MAILALIAAGLGIALLALLQHLRNLEAPFKELPQPPPSRPGIWMMAHRADLKYPFQHLFLRLTPTDQTWVQRHPDLFCNVDDAGLAYATVGAGPLYGKLVLAFNRPTDLGDPIRFEEELFHHDVEMEDASISGMLVITRRYADHLDFSTWSQVTGKGYNCNSMIAALCRHTGLPLARFTRVLLLTPGIERPVPAKDFEEKPLD